jgi:hypothetical protein
MHPAWGPQPDIHPPLFDQEFDMTIVHTTLSIAVLMAATLAASAWAASADGHDRHHPAQTAGTRFAQAAPAQPGMGMGAKRCTTR